MAHTYRSLTCPWKTSEATVAIPCRVKNSHWIAVIHHEFKNSVTFLYSDHLNNPSKEDEVNRLFKKNTAFSPKSATLIHCPSCYYLAGPNDSGPIAFLAKVAMATYPNPHRNMLMPYMHPIIIQICWLWTATTLMFDFHNFPSINTTEDHTILLSQGPTQTSHKCIGQVQPPKMKSTFPSNSNALF
jgi:hypothetical protein